MDDISPPVRTDIYTKEKRSDIMSRIRSRDTKLELKVRSLLHKAGYRFRLYRKDLPGNPDIVLPKHHTVIFVHGCFWHQHEGCKKASLPKQNSNFWALKLAANKERDTRTQQCLEEMGWNVIVVWQCEEKTGFFALFKELERINQ